MANPDELLTDAREAYREAQHATDKADAFEWYHAAADRYDQLDSYMSSGAYPPADWPTLARQDALVRFVREVAHILPDLEGDNAKRSLDWCRTEARKLLEV